jgi:uncharacterized protein YndB with AHSA1/START domain
LSVTSVDKDYDNLTVTLIADFDAPMDRVWALWSDPRKLERWWGPPDHPATVETHDLTPGGEVKYLMTSPDGKRTTAYGGSRRSIRRPRSSSPTHSPKRTGRRSGTCRSA